jgi:hypothetical protein
MAADNPAVRDDDFAEAAQAALDRVSDEPYRLRTGDTIVPRVVLKDLAEMAAEWPPGDTVHDDLLQGSFFSLANQTPLLLPGYDERFAARVAAHGLLVAMISMDEGGHTEAANVCRTALRYMASLPAWESVDLGAHIDDGTATE